MSEWAKLGAELDKLDAEITDQEYVVKRTQNDATEAQNILSDLQRRRAELVKKLPKGGTA